MIVKVELKTDMSNDPFHRIPSLEKIQMALEEYSEGFKGVIVLHDSLYDYRYDTKNNSYANVDSKQIIGNIRDVEISNNKLYLIIDIVDSFDINKRIICFFRANMQNIPGTDSAVFDELNIFAVDIVLIGENETVDDDRLSEVVVIRQ